MVDYGGFTSFDVEYDKNGVLVAQGQEDELISYLRANVVTDLFVMSHGWNNDIPEARALYTNFFPMLRDVQKLPNRSFAVMAVFWPSKKFDEPANIPGGAAALGSVSIEQAINNQLDRLKEAFVGDEAANAKIEHARAQIPMLELSQSAQNDYVFALSSLAPTLASEFDYGLDQAVTQIGQTSGHNILQRLSVPLSVIQESSPQGAGQAAGTSTMSGAAAGLFPNIFSGIKGAALAVANIFTYWTMKERAGLVGRTGVIQTVRKARKNSKGLAIRIHFIGHSFGARLVSAAANSLPPADPAEAITTLTLLQGAFSHFGFAQNYAHGLDGVFRSDVNAGKITNEILITHSVHDWAVGLMYPIASRIMNQIGAAIGDRNDPFGGIGRNGAQKTPEAVEDTLLGVGAKYSSLSGNEKIRNLNGDAIITGHSDICKPEIGYVILTAIS